MKIRGNTVGTTTPRANFEQTDKRKSDYIKGREKLLTTSELDSAIDKALTTAKASGEFDGKDGVNGKDGKDGADGQPGKDGSNGKDGVDGKTPVRGVDYYTESDKAEMVSAVISALPKYNGEVVSV
jgi:hypothetical protein